MAVERGNTTTMKRKNTAKPPRSQRGGHPPASRSCPDEIGTTTRAHREVIMTVSFREEREGEGEYREGFYRRNASVKRKNGNTFPVGRTNGVLSHFPSCKAYTADRTLKTRPGVL